MKEAEASTIAEYLDVVMAPCGAIRFRGDAALFRGQPVDEPLLPSIFRDCEGDFDTGAESRLFWRFRQRAVAYTEIEPENDLDWLAMAQHYGLPTRLLDWSAKPLPALWFAVSLKPRKGKRCPVVYAVCADQNDAVFRHRGADRIGNTTDGQLLEDPFEVKKTLFIFPNHITARIAAQDSSFTLHPDRRCFREGEPTALETNRRYKDRIKKIIIPLERADSLRKELNDLGINEAKLFPDMIGLCGHLAWDHGLAVASRHLEREINSFPPTLGRDPDPASPGAE